MANARDKSKKSVNLWVTPEEKGLLLEAVRVAGCQTVSDFIKLAARATVTEQRINLRRHLDEAIAESLPLE